MEEDEKILMLRESEIYEERITKAITRERMLKIKSRGYSSMEKEEILLAKVFIGYLHGIDMSHNEKVFSALSIAIANATAGQSICKILQEKIKEAQRIIQILRGDEPAE